jgi:hypothetical protein
MSRRAPHRAVILASLTWAAGCSFAAPTFDPTRAAASDAGVSIPDVPTSSVTDGAIAPDGEVDGGIVAAPDAEADAAIDGAIDAGADDATPLDVEPRMDALPVDLGAPDASPDAGAADATTPDSGTPFDYVPSNVSLTGLRFQGGPIVVGRGDCTLESSRSPRFSGTCFEGGQPSPLLDVIRLPDNSEAVLVIASSLRVERGIALDFALRIRGSFPVIFLITGDVDIEGNMGASADGLTSGGGARGRSACASAAGGNGANGRGDAEGAAGGGGGGFGTAGGLGGAGARGATSGRAGAIDPDDTLVPLRGGCPGGAGGDADGDGGQGGGAGGAIQISASGRIRIIGSLRVNGGGAEGGQRIGGGAGGGGSGGALLLEARTIELPSGGELLAKGGGGGEGGTAFDSGPETSDAGSNPLGSDDVGNGGQAASSSGGNGGDGAIAGSGAVGGEAGQNDAGGGGGGGGGLGRIRVRASSTCTLDGRVQGALRRDC